MKTLTEIEENELLQKIKFKLTYLGKIEHGDWKHFKWDAEINWQHFEYRTGLGRVTPTPKKWGIEMPSKPSKPKLQDILHCLISDMECGAYTFNEFCDNSGYSNDSIKAHQVYLSCQESGEKLRKALGPSTSEIIEYIKSLEL